MALATLSIDIEARLARLEEGLDKAARINAKAAKDIEAQWVLTSGVVRGALSALTAALSVTALREFVLGTAQAVDALNDIADATGASVEGISALQDVARATGTDIGVVDTALVKLNQALNSAKPDSDAAKALQAIGLSAKELKALDPSEALRRVAVALAGFADDGNKARLTQELLGKSLREVAPLLKDLATQTELVGSVTKEQADQAERFAHAIGAMDLELTKFRRSVISEILPTITDMIRGINAAREAFGGLGSAILALQKSPTDALRSPIENLEKYRAELQRAQEAQDAIGAGQDGQRFDIFGRDRVARAGEAVEKLKQYVTYYERLLGIRPGDDNSGAPPVAPPSRTVGDPFGAATTKAKRGIEADLNFRRSEIAGTEKVNNDLRLAQYDDYLRDRKARVDAEILQNKQVLDFIDQQRAEEEERERQAADGPKKKIEEMSEFAKQAQRNIQDALGDGLLNGLKGNFSSIEQLWVDLLQRMVAQAFAAQLNEALFGKAGKDGAASTAGLLSDLFKVFGGSFAVGSESIPRDMLAVVHKGERIVPAHQNRSGGAGTIRMGDIIVHNDARADAAQVAVITQRAVEQGNRQMLSQLKAAGVL